MQKNKYISIPTARQNQHDENPVRANGRAFISERLTRTPRSLIYLPTQSQFLRGKEPRHEPYVKDAPTPCCCCNSSKCSKSSEIVGYPVTTAGRTEEPFGLMPHWLAPSSTTSHGMLPVHQIASSISSDIRKWRSSPEELGPHNHQAANTEFRCPIKNESFCLVAR